MGSSSSAWWWSWLPGLCSGRNWEDTYETLKHYGISAWWSWLQLQQAKWTLVHFLSWDNSSQLQDIGFKWGKKIKGSFPAFGDSAFIINQRGSLVEEAEFYIEYVHGEMYKLSEVEEGSTVSCESTFGLSVYELLRFGVAREKRAFLDRRNCGKIWAAMKLEWQRLNKRMFWNRFVMMWPKGPADYGTRLS